MNNAHWAELRKIRGEVAERIWRTGRTSDRDRLILDLLADLDGLANDVVRLKALEAEEREANRLLSLQLAPCRALVRALDNYWRNPGGGAEEMVRHTFKAARDVLEGAKT